MAALGGEMYFDRSAGFGTADDRHNAAIPRGALCILIRTAAAGRCRTKAQQFCRAFYADRNIRFSPAIPVSVFIHRICGNIGKAPAVCGECLPICSDPQRGNHTGGDKPMPPDFFSMLIPNRQQFTGRIGKFVESGKRFFGSFQL